MLHDPQTSKKKSTKSVFIGRCMHCWRWRNWARVGHWLTMPHFYLASLWCFFGSKPQVLGSLQFQRLIFASFLLLWCGWSTQPYSRATCCLTQDGQSLGERPSNFVLLVARLHLVTCWLSNQVTCVALSYNVLLVYNQVLILLLNVTDRDSLLLVCRLFAGFIYCDHWKAAATQVIWIMLKSTTPPHVSDPQHDEIHEFWDVFLWEVFRQFVFIAPMWLLWFAVEYFVKQFSELMVQKADMLLGRFWQANVMQKPILDQTFDSRIHLPRWHIFSVWRIRTASLNIVVVVTYYFESRCRWVSMLGNLRLL